MGDPFGLRLVNHRTVFVGTGAGAVLRQGAEVHCVVEDILHRGVRPQFGIFAAAVTVSSAPDVPLDPPLLLIDNKNRPG